MSGLFDFFRAGGVFMVLVTLLGLTGLALAAAQLALVRRLDLAGVAVGMVAATLLAGATGSLIGWIHVFAAVAAVAPDQKLLLLGAGLSEGLTPTLYALGWVLLALLPLALGLTLRANPPGTRA